MGDLIKSLFPEDKSKNGLKVSGKQRKYILGLVTLAFIGAFAMFFSNFQANDDNTITEVTKKPLSEKSEMQTDSTLALTEKNMEEKLAKILGQIAGVGEVSVNLTLDSSPEFEYAINSKINKAEINERAQDGSTRTTTETTEDAQVVMQNMTQGREEPVVVKEVRPQIVGVMVVAQGATDLVIKERLSEAVQTLLNIPAHRVTILPKGR